MIKLHSDIFLFENILPNQICDKLISLRNNSGHKGRIDLHLNDMELFYEFDAFWFEQIEDVYLNEYLKIYDTENGVGLNSNSQTIVELKKFNKTKWRDLFLLYYDNNNMTDGKKNVHWDFSNITVVICLNDDYDGGELVFPRQEVACKLKKGDLILFPGGLTHPHFAEPVYQGYRNVLVGQSMTLEQNHKIIY